MKSIKHIPRRTCLACRQLKIKPELIRLVRLSNGIVEVDTSGKKAGRGAYLCWSPRCWEIGLKGGRLEHTLRTRLSGDNREQLIRFGEDLLQGEVRGK